MARWSEEALAGIAKLQSEGRVRDTLPLAPRPEEEAPPAEADEKVFMARVIKLALANQWLLFHTHDSRRSRAGYPDLSMARVTDKGGRFVLAELKKAGGRVRPEQKDWAAVLGAIGGPVEYYLWRPEDWPQIVETLK